MTNNETITDIIRKIRAEADSIEKNARGCLIAGETWDGIAYTESDLESALDIAETKRREADRLEAALKREVDDAEMRGHHAAMKSVGEVIEKIGPLYDAESIGNSAKQREALIQARSAICKFAEHQCDSLSWENSNIQANCGDVLCSRRGLCDAKTAINAALAAPPRNCDIGTAEEQEKRHMSWCAKSKDFSCHVKMCKDCFARWVQMPYEEGSNYGQ